MLFGDLAASGLVLNTIVNSPPDAEISEILWFEFFLFYTRIMRGHFNPLDPTDEFTRHFGPLHLWKPFQTQ